MKEELKNLLVEEIKSEIQDLSSLSPGSKEKSTAIEDLAQLYKLKIEGTNLISNVRKRLSVVLWIQIYKTTMLLKKISKCQNKLRIDILD